MSIGNAAPFDVLGLPALAPLCGLTSDGLPIGLQIVVAPFAEGTVLALTRAYEQPIAWHNRGPEAT